MAEIDVIEDQSQIVSICQMADSKQEIVGLEGPYVIVTKSENSAEGICADCMKLIRVVIAMAATEKIRALPSDVLVDEYSATAHGVIELTWGVESCKYPVILRENVLDFTRDNLIEDSHDLVPALVSVWFVNCCTQERHVLNHIVRAQELQSFQTALNDLTSQ